MKKTSNILILCGIILIIIICLFKFGDFCFGSIPDIQSKYVWWGLITAGAVVLIVILSKSSTTSTQASDWLGGFVKFMWGLLQAVFVIVILAVLIVGLWLGGLWAKDWIDNWVRQDDCSVKQLVVIRPGVYTTVDINGFNSWSFMPPVSTLVEYLDQSGRPIPVECNGVLVNYIVSPPGVDYKVSAGSEFRFLRMSSADPTSGEYPFVIKLE